MVSRPTGRAKCQRLDECAAATGPGTGCAAEAMITGKDFAILHYRGIDVPKAESTIVVAPLHLKHLIEVAIEDFAAPADINRVATHQTIHRRRVERVV